MDASVASNYTSGMDFGLTERPWSYLGRGLFPAIFEILNHPELELFRGGRNPHKINPKVVYEKRFRRWKC